MRASGPSQVLVDQTSTALSSPVAGALVGCVVAVVLYRILIIRDRRPTTTAANWYGFWIALYAATRIPFVQGWILLVPGVTLSDVRVLGSTADVAAALSLLLLALRWRAKTGMTARWTLIAVWVGTVGAGVALVLLDMPARSAGIAIEEVGGWRFAVYATIYSGVFIPAEALIVVTLIQMVRQRASVARKALVAFLLLAIAMSVVSLSTRVLGAWLSAFDVDTVLSHYRSAVENDVAFYASVLWLIPAAAPLVVSDIRSRMGLDRTELDEIQKLHPMWETLTQAAPAFRLTEMHSNDLPSQTERIHRMRIEIEDIARAMTLRLPADFEWPEDARGRARLLREATDRFVHGSPAVMGAEPPAWLADEEEVDRVAEEWDRAEASGSNGLAVGEVS